MTLFFFALLALKSSPVYSATEAIRLHQVDLDQLFPPHLADPSLAEDPSAGPSPDADAATLGAFFRLRDVLSRAGLNARLWFRSDHLVYVLDRLPAADRAALADLFTHLSGRIEAGDHDVRGLLNRAPHARLVAEVAAIDAEATLIKRQHKSVIRLAVAKHEIEFNQEYDGRPYSYHLRAVRRVLKQFGFGPKDSFLGLQLGTAAWLHDLIEDTDVPRALIARLYGSEIARMVWGVTKVKKREGLSKEGRLRESLARTAKYKGSRILKLADRIANVEEGILNLFLGRETKVHKYIAEWPIFRELLYRPGEADAMWRHLEGLLTNRAYAEQFSLKRFVRCEHLIAAG